MLLFICFFKVDTASFLNRHSILIISFPSLKVTVAIESARFFFSNLLNLSLTISTIRSLFFSLARSSLAFNSSYPCSVYFCSLILEFAFTGSFHYSILMSSPNILKQSQQQSPLFQPPYIALVVSLLIQTFIFKR